MRRLIERAIMLGAALMVMSIPVLADDISVIPTREPAQQQSGKDECLLVAMNCGDRAESIQNRIYMIQTEIKKGTSVYTTDELNILQKKLDDANAELNEAYSGGA